MNNEKVISTLDSILISLMAIFLFPLSLACTLMAIGLAIPIFIISEIIIKPIKSLFSPKVVVPPD